MSIRGSHGALPRPKGQGDGEARAPILLAHHGDLAVHQLDELSTDGQAQARASELARRAPVDLGELLEKPDCRLPRCRRRCRTPQSARHQSCGRLKASPVPSSVNFTPFATRFVSTWRIRSGSPTQSARRLRIKLALDTDSLHPTGFAIEATDVGHDPADVELRLQQGQLAGLDLRDVEDIVENPQQRLPDARITPSRSRWSPVRA